MLFSLISQLGRERVCSFHVTISCYLPSAMVDWYKLASVSGLFLGHRAHTVKHCTVRWQSLVGWWGGYCIAGTTRHKQPQHTKAWFIQQALQHIGRQTKRLGHEGWVGTVCVCFYMGRDKEEECVQDWRQNLCATFNQKKEKQPPNKIISQHNTMQGKQFIAWEALKTSKKKL